MLAPAVIEARREGSVTARDVLSNDRFQQVRPRLQPLVAEIRRQRRHRLGSRCTIAFENRETVLWQIQEVLRVEHRSEPHHVDEELARYEALIPRPGELRATVLVDGGPFDVADALCQRLGTDPSTLELRVDEKACFAQCVDEHPELSSPVRYVRFDVGSSGIRPIEIANQRTTLLLHGCAAESETLSCEVRRALATDLCVGGRTHVSERSLFGG